MHLTAELISRTFISISETYRKHATLKHFHELLGSQSIASDYLGDFKELDHISSISQASKQIKKKKKVKNQPPETCQQRNKKHFRTVTGLMMLQKPLLLIFIA